MKELDDLKKAIDDFVSAFMVEFVEPWAMPVVRWLDKCIKKWQTWRG